MTNSTVNDDHKVDDEKVDPEATDDDVVADQSSKGPWRWVAAVLLVVALGGGVLGYLRYDDVSSQLAQLRQTEADRAAAAQLAEDYALKSLNYTFEDPDAFFSAVEDGVAQPLKDKYVSASELLRVVMLEAQVSSTGEVLATDPVAQADGSYQVVVAAHQTTRNLQNPTPKVSIILLQVTVNKVGDAWQVSDIGPKTGAQRPVEQQIPGAQLPIEPEPVPSPVPAPAKPAPPR